MKPFFLFFSAIIGTIDAFKRMGNETQMGNELHPRMPNNVTQIVATTISHIVKNMTNT